MGSRSTKKPVTPADKALSTKHLKEDIAYNQRHADQHDALASKEKANKDAAKYNQKHAEKHRDMIAEDREELKKRKGKS